MKGVTVTKYSVKIHKNGRQVGKFGPFGSKKLAMKYAQKCADSMRDCKVTVHPSSSKKTSRTRAPAGRTNPRKRMSTRVHKGHAITGTSGDYTVQPYGENFKTLKAAKAWVDRHVAATKRRGF